MRAVFILGTSVLWLMLLSCSGQKALPRLPDMAPAQTIQQAGLTLQLGQSVSEEQADLIRTALGRLESLKLRPSSPRHKTAFSRAFGSDSLEAVKSFLKERLHVVVGFQRGFSDENAAVPLENVSNKLSGHRLMAQYGLEKELYDSLDGLSVDHSRIRLGWLEVHPSFKIDSDRSAITTLKDLVHEARHSDCTGGAFIRKKDAPPKRIDSPMGEQLEQAAEKVVCFHPHAVCPGDPADGVRACDDHPWGSYTFEYLLLRELTLRCQNCTDMEDFLARFDVIFRAGRLMYLPKPLFAELRGLQDKMSGWSKSGVGLKNPTVEKTLRKLDNYLRSSALPNPDLGSLPFVQ